MYDGLEVFASVLCLSAARRPGRGRMPALYLGLGLLSWALGDVMASALAAYGPVPAVSPADFGYILTYPLLYVGIVVIARRDARRLLATTWLDAGAAGMGAAALGAAFIFHGVARLAGGPPLGVAVSLAYPMGDLVLLAIVVAGMAIQATRSRQWMLLGGACLLNAVGDTFNVLGSTGAGGLPGYINSVAWPIATVMVSWAAWYPTAPATVSQDDEEPRFVLPGLGAAVALGILALAQARHISSAAVTFATLALVAVGCRLALSLRELQSLTRHRRRLAVTDELTGLGNRRRLFEALDSHLGGGKPEDQIALLFIDLNRFKEVNDSFGHTAGDQLLRQLGPRLRSALRPDDLLVRLGGDELAVILVGADATAATEIARRLEAQVTTPFCLGPARVQISASIGIAFAPEDASAPVDLIRCADTAMYRAKETGSPFAIYNPKIDDEHDRLRLAEDLKEAIDQRRLILHYQIQEEPQSGAIVGLEALCRWDHPRLGWIPPLDFLPVAEESGLMGDLTELVIDQALDQTASWWARGFQLTVSVNISASNLLEPGFPAKIASLLARHQLPASALILEITETVIIADFEVARPAVEELRRAGVGLSIDDFGAGVTSLASLGSLVVDELKLDRCFLAGLSGWGRDMSLVAATIELGHALGMRVVAEGVEDAKTSKALARLGCDVLQGYYLGRPVPAAEIDPLLQGRWAAPAPAPAPATSQEERPASNGPGLASPPALAPGMVAP
jgi:diguanylate cyclase (GGDEF)-like protein